MNIQNHLRLPNDQERDIISRADIAERLKISGHTGISALMLGLILPGIIELFGYNSGVFLNLFAMFAIIVSIRMNVQAIRYAVLLSAVTKGTVQVCSGVTFYGKNKGILDFGGPSCKMSATLEGIPGVLVRYNFDFFQDPFLTYIDGDKDAKTFSCHCPILYARAKRFHFVFIPHDNVTFLQNARLVKGSRNGS